VQNYQTFIYVYSGSAVIYEKNLTTEKEAAYIHGPAGILCKNVNGLTDYYHTDHLGSTRLITDESGNPVTDIQYTPFGDTITQEEERFLYTGKERDATGLYYYGARYYDPAIGRFLTKDPAAGKTYNPQSLNQYIYCVNNPLKYIDPAGLSEEEVIIEFYDTTHPEIYVSNWEGFLKKLRQLWTQLGYSASKIRELIIEHLTRLVQMLADSYGLVAFDKTAFRTLNLMAFLEAVVHVFGDIVGITGAFICIEGLAVVGGGGQGGLCLVYHPDLGWAMYTYAGYLLGGMESAGVAVVAGFWTWNHGRDFTFDDWKGWFFNVEGNAGATISGGFVYFEDYYWPSRIKGWGVGAGAGIGGGVAFGRIKYYRAPDWMIPYFLWGKVVPQGK
jgi:RHS repeat-associated protein